MGPTANPRYLDQRDSIFFPFWRQPSEEEREAQGVLYAQGSKALASFPLSMCSWHADGMAVAVRFCWLMADALSLSLLPELKCTFPLLLYIWRLLFAYKTMFHVTAPHDGSLRQQQVLPPSTVFLNFFPSSLPPSVTLSLIISFFSCIVVICFYLPNAFSMSKYCNCLWQRTGYIDSFFRSFPQCHSKIPG